MLWIITAAIISYLVGSIPTAYIFGRLIKGIDIRSCGSGNIGATNAFRVLGKGAGIMVLLFDVLKGFFTVAVLGSLFTHRTYFIQEQNLLIIMGLCSVCGHIWTVFLRFKGGKGIATSLGVLIALSLKMTGLIYVILTVVMIWLLIFSLSRFVSLASLSAAVALPLFSLIFRQPALFTILSTLLCLFAFLRHKSNISRLIAGKEPRLFSKNNHHQSFF